MLHPTRVTRHRPAAVLAAVLAVGLLFVVACSSDKKSVGTTVASMPATSAESPSTRAAADTTTAQTTSVSDSDLRAVIARISSSAAEGGLVLDDDCVVDLVVSLSPADIDVLAKSAADPESSSPLADVSAEGQATLAKISSCATVAGGDPALVSSAADVAISAVSEGTTQTFDRSCVETAFAALSPEKLEAIVAADEASLQEELRTVLYLMVPCLLDGSSTSTSSS
jgi:hypothetical protein